MIRNPEKSIKVLPDRDSPTVNFLLVPIKVEPFGLVRVECFNYSAKRFVIGSLILMNEILSNQGELNTHWQISSSTLGVSPNIVSAEKENDKRPGIGRRTFALLGLAGLTAGLTLILKRAFPPHNSTETKPVTFTTAIVTSELKVMMSKSQNEEYVEYLGNEIVLRMVKVIHGGFSIGQTEAEKTQLLKEVDKKDYQNYFATELPRHKVTVPDFFMGMFTVTQAQWQAVAQLPKIKIDLKPDPSYFKGNVGEASRNENRPVEQISWNEAIEFCDRLSAKTGRTYTLPSEAQWEYACRAGTQTAFAFGDILTPELANYDWTSSYNGSPKRSSYPRETQPVGSYPANAWGLYDMHGNVWEWCQDDWHDNYNGAPTDGSAWLDKNVSPISKILRGGSWVLNPRYCRSAYRYRDSSDSRYYSIGFRVCCLAPRVLP